MYGKPSFSRPHEIAGLGAPPLSPKLMTQVGAGMNAELVLDRGANSTSLRSAGDPVRTDQEIWAPRNSEMPRVSFRGASGRRASHEMHDTFSAMSWVAPGDEDLLAGDPIMLTPRGPPWWRTAEQIRGLP